MSAQAQNVLSVQNTFECFRFDTAAQPDLFPIPSHNHYFAEFLLVRSGVCRIVRNGTSHRLAPGEAIFFSPLIRHSVDSDDGKPVVFDVIKFSATRLREIPSYMADLRSLAVDAAQARLQFHMSAEEVCAFHLDSIAREIIVENASRAFAWELQVRALLYLLITGLGRLWISKRDAFVDRFSPEPDPVLAIPAYIEQHIGEPLRVEDLARRCGMSYQWFAKRFHDYFGISCKQCVERLRIDAVEQYLLYTDLDLREISGRTGFTDCSHMVKAFRKMNNVTPGQFRSLLKT